VLFFFNLVAMARPGENYSLVTPDRDGRVFWNGVTLISLNSLFFSAWVVLLLISWRRSRADSSALCGRVVLLCTVPVIIASWFMVYLAVSD
jgi:hypothetical protein